MNAIADVNHREAYHTFTDLRLVALYVSKNLLTSLSTIRRFGMLENNSSQVVRGAAPRNKLDAFSVTSDEDS
jgi:hypothetical protein